MWVKYILILSCVLFCFPVFGEEANVTIKSERNPFLSPIEEILKHEVSSDDVPHVESENLFLSGTLITEGVASAIVNDVIVREGDMILGFEVVLIRRESVVLAKEGEKYILRMGILEQGEER